MGGFGNLIALPLQSRPREKANSVFLNGDFFPYADPWTYLSTIGRLSRAELISIASEAAAQGQIIGMRRPSMEEQDEPWAGRATVPAPPIEGSFPTRSRSCWAIRSLSAERTPLVRGVERHWASNAMAGFPGARCWAGIAASETFSPIFWYARCP